MKYRPEIDGLRAIAVLPVVLYHAGLSFLGGGYVGVDVFFVISGFLITTMISEDLARDAFSIVGFYERRVRRIFPASFAMIVGASALAWFLLPPTDFREFGQSVVSASTFVSNVFFWLKAGYFEGPARMKPLLHTWSLAVEEQFYIVFPFLLATLYRWRRQAVTGVVWVLLLASLAVSVWVTGRAPSAAFYLAPFRGWELLLGSVLALGGVPPLRNGWLREALSALGVLAIGWSVVVFTDKTSFPGANAILPCAGTALVIHAGAGGATTVVGRLLSTRPVVFVGKISYSLYLWHWPVIVFAGYWFVLPATGGRTAIALAIAFVAAIGSWKWVEQPFRRRQLGTTRARLFRFAAVASALTFTFGAAAHLSGGWPRRFSLAVRENVRRFDGARGDYNRDRSRCHASDEMPISFADKCVYGVEGASPTEAIWGDSFAAELSVALGRVAKAHAQSLLYISYSGCPPVIGVFQGARPLCEAHNADMVKHLSESTTITTVILVARYESYEFRYGDILPGLERVAQALARAGKRVIITYPIPEPPGDVPSMLARYAQLERDPHDLHIDRAEYERVNAATIAFLNRLTEQPGIVGAHPETRLCDQTRCELYVDDTVLYFDANHLSIAGATYVMPAFDAAFAAPGREVTSPGH